MTDTGVAPKDTTPRDTGTQVGAGSNQQAGDGTSSSKGGSETGGAGSQANSGQKAGAPRKYNYPIDVDNVNYPHTINIQIFSSGGGGAKDGADKSVFEGSESDVGNDAAGTTAEGGGGVGGKALETISEQAGNIRAQFAQGSTQLTADINLIMTNSPVNRMSAQWDAMDFGLLGAALEQFRKDKNLQGIVKNISENSAAGSEYLIRQTAALFNIGKQLGINLPVNDSISVFTRKVENPFKEQLFKTMNFRSFPMEIKFAPRSGAELREVMNIIYQLEWNMHPERETLFLRYPAEFKITYQYNGSKNKFLNEINRCVLTDMQVSYGHNGFMTSFEGGAPTEITVSLNFKEVLLRDRKQINPYGGGGAVAGTTLPPVVTDTGSDEARAADALNADAQANGINGEGAGN